MLIHGINPVAEALEAGRLREIRVAGRGDLRLARLVDEAARRGVTVRRVTREALDQATRHAAHQGVVAVATPAPAVTLVELVVDGPRGERPLVVVLDGVEDPQNVGAILRSVDAAGASGVVRQTRRAAPIEGAAAKASAGAVHHVRVADVVNIARAIEDLKQAGVWAVGLDAGAKMPYHEWDLTLPTALVVGAEGHGLRRLVRERCDRLVSIPMRGHVASLNVSAAAAVVLYEAVRQRSRGRPGP